ncbi:tetratricopeptide repeat protein [Flavobacterium suncheonense]|uniref:BatE protein n=1 Tax=Flavobacterium suncheonense GH29-5 = DSM 17707 TaxID=1121899 RepID=A0A0A2MAB0_9FLAO|nr:tetratricopeptide repeat protein [Flavobacterium suncheonense]KGO89169.1 BatE protein [Flavobacterium suncheonense GH29-5 = DSM 17707]
MKKLVYLFLMIAQTLFAQSVFQKGNELYKSEQFEEAVGMYEGILKSGQQSAELHFNLGNAYYKLHKVAPAIYHYEKALLLQPNDAEIQTNLKFAQKMAIDEIKVVPKVGFSQMLNEALDVFHYDTWAWIATVFSTVFLLFFTGYYFGPTSLMKRLFFAGMILALLVIAVSVGAAVLERKHYNSERPAIVFAEVAPVKNEPKAAAPAAFELHEGTKVFVLETQDKWAKIELTDETQGWIERAAIKELKQF